MTLLDQCQSANKTVPKAAEDTHSKPGGKASALGLAKLPGGRLSFAALPLGWSMRKCGDCAPGATGAREK